MQNKYISETAQSLLHDFRLEIDLIYEHEDNNIDQQLFYLSFIYLKRYPILIDKYLFGSTLPLFKFQKFYNHYFDSLHKEDQAIAKQIFNKAEFK